MADDTPRCAVCAVSVFTVQGRKCPTCGVLYHQDCWDWVGNCSIFGCKGTSWTGPRRVARRPAAERPVPDLSLRRLVLHNIIVMVVPVVALAFVWAAKAYYGSRTMEEMMTVAGGLCALYVLFGGLVDSRHPFTFTQRHAESGLIKSRLILSVLLMAAWPAGWFTILGLQIALAIAMRVPRRVRA